MPLVTPRLHSARLTLRPFTPADTDAIFAVMSKSRVMRYWDSPAWKERAQAERFIANAARGEQEGTDVRLAIERDGVLIGQCGFFRWNPTFRSAAIGYCLDDSAWGQGFGTEAVSAVLGWAFETLDLNRVQAELDTRNPASARLLEKLGFVREGTLREDCIVDGEVSDSWIYGLLRRQWSNKP